jgi:hypothetical protein
MGSFRADFPGGFRGGMKLFMPLLFQVCVSLDALAQACPNDAEVVFRNEVGGVVTLNPPRVGNIVRGGNRDDRATRVNLGGEQTGRAQGTRYVVDSIPTSVYPGEAAALRPGFNRTIGRLVEVNYPRNQYVFASRDDLDAEITFSIPGDEARSTAVGSGSTATLSAQLTSLDVAWWSGGNSLRRLRARVQFTFSNLQNLEQPGAHRASLGVCVEVNGAI